MGGVKSQFNIEISQELIKQAQQGQMQAHERLFHLFSSAVYHLALSTIKHPQIAEDILQNTFINVLNKAHQFRFESPFGLWLRKITVNQILMYIRKHNTQDQSMDTLHSDNGINNIVDLHLAGHAQNPANAQQAQVEFDLQRVLEQLPVQTRTILWLKEVEGYTHQEIGVLMGKTASYSKSLVARAYEVLRKRHSHFKTTTLKESR
ncbi:RNA polymerase sigma factor [Marinicella sp. W31]|uniref:RNA polymerase sigma factor n=1 Tax=Marinicella sp. W31 TaxID=3023713 RepID=UPI00375717FB